MELLVASFSMTNIFNNVLPGEKPLESVPGFMKIVMNISFFLFTTNTGFLWSRLLLFWVETIFINSVYTSPVCGVMPVRAFLFSFYLNFTLQGHRCLIWLPSWPSLRWMVVALNCHWIIMSFPLHIPFDFFKVFCFFVLFIKIFFFTVKMVVVITQGSHYDLTHPWITLIIWGSWLPPPPRHTHIHTHTQPNQTDPMDWRPVRKYRILYC